MPDSFTEITEQSWGSRIVDSIKGVVFGGLLFLTAFVVLFKNEGCAVQSYKSIKEGQGACVALAEPKPMPQHDKQLIHFTAKATTEDDLADTQFGVEAKDSIALVRNVEMYQWKQSKKSRTKKKLGGGTQKVTETSYSKEWSSSYNDSSDFKDPSYSNPPMPYKRQTFYARNVIAGGFVLPDALIRRISGTTSIPASRVDISKLPSKHQKEAQVTGDQLYIGNSGGSPEIGDLRITFSRVEPKTVSIIAQQAGNTLQPYQTQAGDPMYRLQVGSHSPEAMFDKARDEAKLRTWLIRIGGFVMMLIGLGLVFKPLSVLADVVPFIGSLVGVGMGLFALVIAFALSLITIAIAWVFYRPLLGIPLLLIGVGAIVAIIIKGMSARRSIERA